MSWHGRFVFRRRRYNDLSVSIREHLEEKIDELMEDGMSREEATRAARRQFGNATQIEQRSREVWQLPTVETIVADGRFALRQLSKSPGFTFMAVLIMALGIGANTAIFSVVRAVLLEPLPFREADQLVQIWHVPPQSSFPGMSRFAVSAANFLDWQKQNNVFSAMALASGGAYEITGKGKPETIRASTVTHNFFSVLGVQPIHGRVFLPEEDQPGHNNEIILSFRMWQSRFGSNPNVIGQTMPLDGAPYVIVGVMGPKMNKPDVAQAWIPLGLTAEQAAVRGEHHFSYHRAAQDPASLSRRLRPR